MAEEEEEEEAEEVAVEAGTVSLNKSFKIAIFEGHFLEFLNYGK